MHRLRLRLRITKYYYSESLTIPPKSPKLQTRKLLTKSELNQSQLNASDKLRRRKNIGDIDTFGHSNLHIDDATRNNLR